jgi:hypothetical protein
MAFILSSISQKNYFVDKIFIEDAQYLLNELEVFSSIDLVEVSESDINGIFTEK